MRTGAHEGAPEGAKQKPAKEFSSTFPATPQLSPDYPNVIDLPVENLHPRPMRAAERSLLVACWWRWRREGIELPAEHGVIVIDGGRR